MKIGAAISIIASLLMFAMCSINKEKVGKMQACKLALAEYTSYEISPRTSTENLNKIIKVIKSSQTNCSKGDVVLWMTERNFISAEGSRKFMEGTTGDELLFFCNLFHDVPESSQGWVRAFEEDGKIVLTASALRMGPMVDSRDMFVLNSNKYPLRKFPN